MSRLTRRAAFACLLCLPLLGLVSPVSALAAACQTVTGPAGGPYADCGGGQVYNILPPGENGLVNAATAATRQPPPHGDDQRSMYADLVRVAPHLQPADLGRYFKQAGLSVSAQILQSLRRVESWLLWIAVDALAIGLFLWRDLLVTAALYALFFALAVAGLIEWKRKAAA